MFWTPSFFSIRRHTVSVVYGVFVVERERKDRAEKERQEVERQRERDRQKQREIEQAKELVLSVSQLCICSVV